MKVVEHFRSVFFFTLLPGENFKVAHTFCEEANIKNVRSKASFFKLKGVKVIENYC